MSGTIRFTHSRPALRDDGDGPTLLAAEIREQPQALARTLLDQLGEMPDWLADILAGVERVRILGCGSSLHAGLAGRWLIEEWAGVPVDVENAAEERERPRLLRGERELVIGITRMGEAADTLAAMRIARGQGIPVLAIADGSAARVTRDADGVLLTGAGLEISGAATKTFTCQLATLGAIALRLAEAREVPWHVLGKLERRLREWPEVIEDTLAATREPMRALAGRLADAERFLFVGRGAGLPIAREGSLKFAEVAQMPGEARAGGDLKDLVLTPGMPVIAVATAVLPKLLNDLAELRAREARIIVIASERDTEVLECADDVVWLPTADLSTAGVAAAVSLQLLAYELAALRAVAIA